MTKEEIREWLDSSDHSRKWLAHKCGVMPKTVNNWLGSEQSIPLKAIRMIEALMKADTVSDTHTRLIFQVTPEEFEHINQASLLEKTTVKQWIVSHLNELATSTLEENKDRLTRQ